jgi:predicted transcriptional regulator
MSKSAVVTARLDDATLALVDHVAKSQGRSRSWFVARAVQRVAESEAEFLAFVQVGDDAIARGDVVGHKEVMDELDQMIDTHKARCAR